MDSIRTWEQRNDVVPTGHEPFMVLNLVWRGKSALRSNCIYAMSRPLHVSAKAKVRSYHVV